MYRDHHKAEPLIFNPELASQAYEYACELATANKGLTSSNPGKGKNQGENLFWNSETFKTKNSYLEVPRGHFR